MALDARLVAVVQAIGADIKTLFAAGVGRPIMQVAEVNLGWPARRSGTFMITGLTGLTVGKPVQIALARGPYSGKGTRPGEEGMYPGQITAQVTAADTITASFAFACRIGGTIKFNYSVGA